MHTVRQGLKRRMSLNTAHQLGKRALQYWWRRGPQANRRQLRLSDTRDKSEQCNKCGAVYMKETSPQSISEREKVGSGSSHQFCASTTIAPNSSCNGTLGAAHPLKCTYIRHMHVPTCLQLCSQHLDRSMHLHNGLKAAALLDKDVLGGQHAPSYTGTEGWVSHYWARHRIPHTNLVSASQPQTPASSPAAASMRRPSHTYTQSRSQHPASSSAVSAIQNQIHPTDSMQTRTNAGTSASQ